MIKKFLKEPVLHYVLLGGLLYFAVEYVSSQKAEEKQRIEVQPEVVQAYLKRDEEISGKKSTEEDRAQTIENIIDEEVMLREAYAVGYDKTDPRVRKRLLTLMRSALTPSVADPTATQLQEFYQQKKADFLSEPSYDYQQVYFSHVSKGLPEDSDAFVEMLEGAENPLDYGESYAYGHIFKGQGRERVAMYFGAEMAAGVETHEAGTWFGPVRSRVGTHYVRVLKKNAAREPSFEEVEPYLKESWIYHQVEQQQDAALKALRNKYEIEVPESDA